MKTILLIIYLLFLNGCTHLEIKDGKTTYNVAGVKLNGSGSTYEDKDNFGITRKTQDFNQISIEF